jgi:hypothetical protein
MDQHAGWKINLGGSTVLNIGRTTPGARQSCGGDHA